MSVFSLKYFPENCQYLLHFLVSHGFTSEHKAFVFTWEHWRFGHVWMYHLKGPLTLSALCFFILSVSVRILSWNCFYWMSREGRVYCAFQLSTLVCNSAVYSFIRNDIYIVLPNKTYQHVINYLIKDNESPQQAACFGIERGSQTEKVFFTFARMLDLFWRTGIFVKKKKKKKRTGIFHNVYFSLNFIWFIITLWCKQAVLSLLYFPWCICKHWQAQDNQ